MSFYENFDKIIILVVGEININPHITENIHFNGLYHLQFKLEFFFFKTAKLMVLQNFGLDSMTPQKIQFQLQYTQIKINMFMLL